MSDDQTPAEPTDPPPTQDQPAPAPPAPAGDVPPEELAHLTDVPTENPYTGDDVRQEDGQ